MYGVNSGVNFPNGYGYGKKTQAQSPFEQRNTPETKTSGRTDEILFSATYRKGNYAVSSLSDEAKNLLAELREKYKGYDFMVADYETDEEASRLLSQGRGEYNVLITPDLLEKMASDKSERAKYEDIIAGASDKFSEIEKNLTESGKSIVEKLGFTVDADGNVNFYATLTGGVNTENGDKSVKAALVNELTDMVNTLAENRAKELEEAKNKDKVQDVESTLSDKAKALLSELREKYKGYDFMVGDFETNEQASRILNRGNGSLMNVLITPDLLEKMAADESVRTKYENIIAGAADQFTEVKANLTEGGKYYLGKLGITVNDDGSFDFYAFLNQGCTTEDGKDYVHASSAKGIVGMLNSLAVNRYKEVDAAKEKEDNTPVDKEEEKEKSVLPPKSFEKYQKEPDPYATEEDYGNLPPESFEKYKKEENPYSTEEDYGTLPPESFKKYQTEADTEVAGGVMNYSV